MSLGAARAISSGESFTTSSAYEIQYAKYTGVTKTGIGTDLFFDSTSAKVVAVYDGINSPEGRTYTLSTAGDISTISATASSWAGMDAKANPASGIWAKSDGTKYFFVGDDTVGAVINEVTMNTAWSLTGQTFVNQKNLSGTLSTIPSGLALKTDGTKFYTAASSTIYQFSMTAYTTSTATYDSKSLAAGSFVHSLQFKSDGLTLWVLTNDDVLTEYTLSTAWDISTATASGNTVDMSSESTSTIGAVIIDSGATLVMSDTAGKLYEYQISGVLHRA